jgi:hypothetical protein
MAQHNATHLSALFRSMPFVDDSKDHRLDRPFSTRVVMALAAVSASFVLLRALLKMERTEERRGAGTVKDL